MFELETEQEDYSLLPLEDKIARSIEILRLASQMSWEYYKKPMIICYSGGKDSDVLLNLAEKALPLTDFEVMNSHTTVDAPETVYHIRDTVKRINDGGGTATIHYPHDKDGNYLSMWNLIPQKGILPTRIVRYCCAELKETSTPNRMAVLGVRAAESTKRQGRDVFGVRGGSYSQATFFSLDHTSEVFRESQELKDDVWDCTLIKNMKENNDTIVNAIYEWQDADIWEYINKNDLKINPLYAEGYWRVGCIGCPLKTYCERVKDFERYPVYKQNYLKAIKRLLDNTGEIRNEKYKKIMSSPEAMFNWWMETGKYEIEGQMTIEEYMEDLNK